MCGTRKIKEIKTDVWNKKNNEDKKLMCGTRKIMKIKIDVWNKKNNEDKN